MFRPFTHEPGVRKVLGRTYANDGEGQGQAVLHDLAAHPATAPRSTSCNARSSPWV